MIKMIKNNNNNNNIKQIKKRIFLGDFGTFNNKSLFGSLFYSDFHSLTHNTIDLSETKDLSNTNNFNNSIGSSIFKFLSFEFAFIDNKIILSTPEFNSLIELLKITKNTLNDLENFNKQLNSINDKGFVESVKLRKPLILQEISEFFKLSESFNSYPWVINLLNINFYYRCLYLEDSLIDSLNSSSDLKRNEIEDRISDLENERLKIFNSLDPSIREKIRKRGISVVQNVYSGFDTEYIQKNTNFNELLSVQIAVNTRLFLKIPKNNDFKIVQLHPLTSKIIQNIDIPNLKIIEESIAECIKNIRKLKCNANDEVTNFLIKTLKTQDLVNFEDEFTHTFAFPYTDLMKYIFINDTKSGYKFSDLIKTSDFLASKSLERSYNDFLIHLKSIITGDKKSQITEISEKSEISEISENSENPEYLEYLDFYEKFSSEEIHKITNVIDLPTYPAIKSLSRTTFSLKTEKSKISVSRIKNIYLIAHLTNADLSILNDFESIKNDLTIVNNSFVTLGKPIKIENFNVHIRDTMLLSPAGNRSLESIGKIYGNEYLKKEISDKQKGRMDQLLEKDREKFIDYAIQDAVISLKHANEMENFNLKLKRIGVPLTLSSLGKNYVLDKWSELKKPSYQISDKYLLGDIDSIQTPKGLLVTKNIGLYLPYFIGNYKGGRNESFMYGCDFETSWFDYDLTSAYTTVMYNLGYPDYSKAELLSESDIKLFKTYTDNVLIQNYFIIKAYFKFPEDTKFPSIPCYLDESTTVYPLSGSCLLTGTEYLLAKNQKCNLKIESIFLIPFKRDLELNLLDQPFKEIIQDIQEKRREFPKGHILNMLYKEMGNSMYGNLVRGMSSRKRFDIKTGLLLKMDASLLSNPILASWITAFIRSVIGECLHNISLMGGKVVSVTTDGFITDIQDLESKLLNLPLDQIPLLLEYRRIRSLISGNPTSLELKTNGKGIISWTTRGQLGMESKIKATTGFQIRGYEHKVLVEKFIQILKTNSKLFEYTQSSLRSANAIYKKGGHVTMIFKDQIFRLFFDNKRIILDNSLSEDFDMTKNLLDSKPMRDIEECRKIRLLSSIHRTSRYNKVTSKSRSTKYKNSLEIAVRNFIKGLLAEEKHYGLEKHIHVFKGYKSIIEFIHAYEPAKNISLTKQSISNLKNRKLFLKPVPRTDETESFYTYVKNRLKYFNETEFFKS